MRYAINWIGDTCESQLKQNCLICGDGVERGEEVYGGVLVWTYGDAGTVSRFVCSHLHHGKPLNGRQDNDR